MSQHDRRDETAQVRCQASVLPGAQKLLDAGTLTREFTSQVMADVVTAQLRAGGGAACVGARAGTERFLAYVGGPKVQDGGGAPTVAMILTPEDVPLLPAGIRESVEGYIHHPGFFPE
jgi:hypothetical protein